MQSVSSHIINHPIHIRGLHAKHGPLGTWCASESPRIWKKSVQTTSSTKYKCEIHVNNQHWLILVVITKQHWEMAPPVMLEPVFPTSYIPPLHPTDPICHHLLLTTYIKLSLLIPRDLYSRRPTLAAGDSSRRSSRQFIVIGIQNSDNCTHSDQSHSTCNRNHWQMLKSICTVYNSGIIWSWRQLDCSAPCG